MADLTISIIIITRNRPSVLQRCLKYVLAQPYPYKEIVVVDSSSNDESERLVAQYPEVRLVRLRGQRNNMPQARNAGIAISSGDIIAFIDDDAMAEPDWLDTLVDTYRDETVGAVGGRAIETPKPYCDLLINIPTSYIRPPGQFITKHITSASADQIDVDWLTGSNMSFRRTVLEQVGGFDPGYTVTNLREETDLCLRVKRAGWRLVFNPAIGVVHCSQRSSGRHFEERPLTQFSAGRNSAYFTIKHFGLNPSTLAWQLILAPARTFGLIVYRTGLQILAALAQTAGRCVGLIVGIRWLTSSRQRAESAPKILQSDLSIIHSSDPSRIGVVSTRQRG